MSYGYSLKNIFPLIIVLLILTPLVGKTDTIDDLKLKIDDRNKQLEAIQQEIEQYEKQLEEVGAEKSTLQNAIKALDLTRSKLLADIRKIQKQIDNETLNINKLNIEIEDKEEKIILNNKAITEALKKVNEADNFSMIEGVLSNKSLSDLWKSVESLQRFQVVLEEDIESLKEIKVSLAKNKDEVEERRLNLISQKTELNGKTKVVEQNKSEKNDLLSVTKNKEDNYKTLLEEKVRQRELFERELFEYESRLQFELDPNKLPSSGKGVLMWPVKNVRITQKFGLTSDSKKLYASGSHNGVDFGVPVGTTVMAALGGVVEGTGNTDQYRGCLSYGKWVLVKHSNGLSTLYAHLSVINVSLNQELKTGDIIGFSGNTGYSTGPHLHFTLFASQGVRLAKLGEISGKTTKCAQATIPVAPSHAYLDPLVYLQ
jgi:murein DD-endopeptidase MepM/ murein hydrolase activator NlpD